ncbi:hypothetical protein DXV76_01210 [Rhodobacteraceae bacterium CCMM004]|nr:hypothetical protein DXV76_01210 [Rhodobacteraceae bacterium CCMM004]
MLRTAMILAITASGLAGCVMPQDTNEDGVIDDISPRAIAALPPGVSPAFLIRNADGCYGIEIEVTVPPSGVALTDANGLPICDTPA